MSALARRYKRGESTRQLAAAFEINRTTVLDHLVREGVQRRANSRLMSDAQVTVAARLYLAGSSLAVLGRRFGVNAETVRTELRKAGIARRPAGRSKFQTDDGHR